MKLIAAIALLGLFLSSCSSGKTVVEKDNNSNNHSTIATSNANSVNNTDGTNNANLPPSEPTPTPRTTVGGKQKIAWNGLSWTIPANWTEDVTEDGGFQWKSLEVKGTRLLVTAAGMGPKFPIDESLKGLYGNEGARKNQKQISSYRYLTIGGMKGIESVEEVKPYKETPRHLEWRGYRKYKGEVQMVTIVLSAQNQHFPTNGNEMQAILQSTRVEQK